jgi:protein-S-isoprenylcysteine O-methyltransferase Ste14
MAAFIIPGLDRRFGWSEVPIVLRIVNEEKILKENLEDSEHYCLKTKYRLILYIW